ncbi:hypothetical protein BH24ACT5_BH24ACT5_20380 [soil metagenome]
MVRCCFLRNRASSDSHLPVGFLDLGGDHRVGVQLRVDGARRVLAEQRRGDPVRVDPVDAVSSPTGHRAVGLEPRHGGLDSLIVRGQDLGADEGIRGECPQRRHRLRRRERGIEAPCRRVTESAAERRPVDGMARFEQGSQLFAGHLTREADSRQASAPPPSGWFIGIQVVVHRTTGRPRPITVLGEAGVVGEQPIELPGRRLQRRAPHHRTHPPPGRAAGRTQTNAPVCPMAL